MSQAALHDAMRPLAWILGRWRTSLGRGKFPTISDFTYMEELEFFHVGQPNFQFTFNAFHPETNKPLHREVGFLRVNPGTNDVAFLCAQNLGIAEVEEGPVIGQKLTLNSHTVGRISFGKPPETRKIGRVFERVGDFLEQVVLMETSNTPLTEHLRVTYNKVE